MNMGDGVVEDFMTTHVITAMRDQDIRDVVALMKQHKVKRIVISNEQHHVVGIVTRSNLVKLFFGRYSNTGSAS